MARAIDANKLIEWFSPYLHTGEAIPADVVIEDIRSMPTLTPPNEPMLERVDQADSGCDRCSGPEDTALDAGGAHDFRVVGDAIYYCDSDYGWEGTKIKFCPWCGRSLASNTQVDILTGEKYEE